MLCFRTRPLFPRLLLLIAIMMFFAGLALVELYPYRPASFLGWVALFLLALPVAVALEALGDRTLGTKFVARMSPSTRIAYGVLVVGVFLGFLLLGFHYVKPFLAHW